jgi:hypothetical protein
VSQDVKMEPIRGWLLVNVARLAIYLACASFASAVTFAIDPSGGVGATGILLLTPYLFGIAAFFGLPGTVVWLWIVAHLSPEWSVVKRRLIAMATGPLIGIAWILFFGQDPDAYVPALIFGVVLPAGSGLVVKLRQAQPAAGLGL